MDSSDGSGMRFPHEGGGDSAINPMSSMPLQTHPSSNGAVSLFSSGWDPISSLSQSQSQSQTFGCSLSISNHHFPTYPFPASIWENQGISSSSCTPQQLPHYQPESSFVGFPSFVNRGYSEIANSICPMNYEIANSICPMNYDGGSQARASISQELRSSEEEAMQSPSNERRRKRNTVKSNQGELRKDSPGDTSDVPNEQNKKKHRTEPTESADSRGKQSSKQAKEDSDSGDATKENYIHIRARRGQATNSHSLAERVRREKISERMRLLQELVPGCNKITGKAVMLDEIINYVQSLQQQVEFLSMKLSTLNPDLSNNSNNVESILSKEVVLQSHGRDSMLHGLGPGAGLSLPFAQGIFQGALHGVSSTNQYPPLPRALLDTELQTLLQMGFDSTSAIDMLKSNSNVYESAEKT